jgi:cytochrome c
MRRLFLAATIVAVPAMVLTQTARNVREFVYSDAQAKRGQNVYSDACATCHGDKLEGVMDAPPLAGDAFLKNWTGKTMFDLFDKVRQTMPQDNPGRLTEDQDIDVLAYVLSVNQMPPGPADLSKDADQLKLITFEAK